MCYWHIQYSVVVVVVAVVDLYCLYRFVVVVDVLTLQHVKCRTHVVDVDLYCLYSVCTAGTYNTVVL